MSHVHAYAGRVSEAGQAQDAALAAYPAGNFQGRAQIELHRAAAFIRADDVDTGASHLVSMMERLQPWQREDGILRRTALLTLDMIPPLHRDRSGVRLAREVVIERDK
jgi:hypothetical protein